MNFMYLVFQLKLRLWQKRAYFEISYLEIGFRDSKARIENILL